MMLWPNTSQVYNPPPLLYRLEQSILGKCLHRESETIWDPPPPRLRPLLDLDCQLVFNVPNHVTKRVTKRVSRPAGGTLFSFMCNK